MVKKKKSALPTTGDVAQWLEDKYHLIETFYNIYEDDFGDSILLSYDQAVEDLLLGKPNFSFDAGKMYASALSKMENMFKQSLSQQKFDGLIAGVPTQASLDGVNHRLKIKKGAPRPSFIDTGLYEATFKAWAGTK